MDLRHLIHLAEDVFDKEDLAVVCQPLLDRLDVLVEEAARGLEPFLARSPTQRTRLKTLRSNPMMPRPCLARDTCPQGPSAAWQGRS